MKGMSANRKLQGSRHTYAPSVDTNASGIAESTISLGLSQFPEPPSSIPTSTLHDTPSPSHTTSNQTSIPSTTHPVRRPPRPERPSHPPTTPLRFPTSRPTFKSTEGPSDVPQSSRISPYDWHDGASSIDVDETEDRLLPTSFITSLLQENKDLRKAKRASYASEALSGISEMTYPPLMNRPGNDSAVSGIYTSGRIPTHQRVQDSRTPLLSHPEPTIASNRMSGDSETLHSVQGYPSIIRTANISRTTAAPGMSVVGVAPATIRSISASSQASSIQDSETIGSFTKGYQNKLSTTYESGEELLVDYKKFNSMYSPALPSTAGTDRRILREGSRKGPLLRDSLHSQRSTAPSFISRISKLSRRTFLGWRKVKPLPPVPIIPDISLTAENSYRKEEESTSLPDLVNRAGVLRELLDRGQHPHHSMSSYHGFQQLDSSAPYYARNDDETRKLEYSDRAPTHLSPLHNRTTVIQPTTGTKTTTRKRRRTCLLIVTFLVIALAAIGAGIGVTLGRKKGTRVTCSGNFAGSLCNLDASCVCTSTSGCNGLAQNIINLLPTVNQLFNANFTSASAYSSIWIMQGSSTAGSCTSQAVLVDVGSGLDQTVFSNRTQWTQAAMLWNILQTEDLDSSQKMQSFVQKLPWEKLNSTDGAIAADTTFSTTISGFVYNFALQSISEPATSFVTVGQPSNAQIAKLSSGAHATLDRMYSYAQASATQRQNALKKYWTSVLLQRPDDLAVFKTTLSVSPIMLPFNASSAPIRNLYTTSPTASFPPPLACFPQLNNGLIGQLNSFESSVFGLPAATSLPQFNPTCYTERPIYGVLDVLRLRLPFIDSQLGTVKQAVILSRDAIPRTILYNGPIFSAVLNGTEADTPTSLQMDPRQFGTPLLSDHVILQYLSSIPTITIANALIKFVLNTTTAPIPPDSTSLLFSSLESLPVLEVAVFGDIQPSDMTSTVSPFTNPSGSLFFGSPDGSALRNWTINYIGGSVVWAQNATSPLVVRDKSLSDTTISQTWFGASQAIASNNQTINGPFITGILQGTQDFSP